MLFASDFRKGFTFEINGQPHVVIDFQHVKPGKGAAFVRTKYKNILTGAIREEAFNPDEKFPKAHIETKKMQYSYFTKDALAKDALKVSLFARSEGLTAHARAIEIRFEDEGE